MYPSVSKYDYQTVKQPIKSVLSPSLPAFTVNSLILSYWDYDGYVLFILSQLNKNSKAFLMSVHGQMLRNVLLETPPLSE